MQIHEITEGLLGAIGRGIASGITGVDIPQGQSAITRQAAQAAEKLRAQGYRDAPAAGTMERIVVSLLQPGLTVPSKYIKTGASWSNEMGTVITDLKQKAYLDKMIPTYGKKEIIPVAGSNRKVSRRRISK
jgi:hypothetical protein